MAYVEATVIVDGALDECTEFDYSEVSQDRLTEFIDRQRRLAERDGAHTQVFLLTHDHEQSDTWCMCPQYVTDHHADYEWNESDALVA